MASGMKIIAYLFLFTLVFNFCESKVKKTKVDEDADFGISLLEETKTNKTAAKNNTDHQQNLADAIVRAFHDFRRDDRSKNLDIRSILSVVSVGNLFSARPKRNTDDVEFLDLQEEFDNAKGTVDVKGSESLFKDLSDDFAQAFDEKPAAVFESNINKIPKKVVLSRQAKSLDSNLVKDNSNTTNLSTEALEDELIKPDSKLGVEMQLEVYSIDNIVKHWSLLKKTLSPGCRRDFLLYLRGLKNQKYWALKMDDASGRYSSGYYWGNAYWSGSATLCENVMKTPVDLMKGSKSTDDFTRNDFSFHDVSIDVTEKPLFNVSFYMAKVQLNSSIILGHKTIQLGLCMPDTCTIDDIEKIIEIPQTKTNPKVIKVRDPNHSSYNIFNDLTFQILVGVTVVVTGMIIAGTVYELILISRVRKMANMKNIPPLNGLSSVKISNGKSIYTVNGIPNNNNNSEERLNVEHHHIEDSPQLSIFSELILSFSLVSNMKTICDQSVGSDTIPTIHGLRTLSMIWVILGHSCIVAFKYSDNTELRKVVEKEFTFQAVTNGSFGVDTFFCISGILVSFIYFRTNAKGSLERLTQGTRGFISGSLQFIGLLGYRFARLTAPYLFMLGVVEVSMKWFHYNSVFEPPTLDHINCPKYWWRNVLYINTLFPFEQMCMLWSWYLADDSQFYVLGAIILILATSHFKTATGALVMFLISSWATTGYIAWSNNHTPSNEDPLAMFDKIYDKPWTRLGPYLIGMAAGWFLFKTDCKIKMSKITVITGWALSAFVSLYLVFGLYNVELTPITGAAYSSLCHTAWAISIAWIVIACSTGYGGYINTILSATILYPFSRVTYCAYLVHPIVIRFLPMHMDHPIHLGKDLVTLIFFGQVVASYFLSFVISLAFEAPVVTMLKILAPNKRKKIQ